MREVLRNHNHGSKIVLTKCSFKDVSFYEKSSYSEDGINDLKNEFLGFKWYLSKISLHKGLEVLCDTSGYYKLRIPAFEAKPFDKKLSIVSYFNYAIRAIQHYKTIWGDNKFCLQPLHGDFSLEGNILFNDNNVFLIDWEHFHSKIAPLGFDILYMVFELIKMEFKNNEPSAEELLLAKQLIVYAESIGVMNSFYRNNYFKSFLSQQEKIKFVWKGQYHKLPTTQFTSHQTQVITDYFDPKKNNG